MKKLMVLSAIVSMLALWSCGNDEDDEMLIGKGVDLEDPHAPRHGRGLGSDGSNESGGGFTTKDD